LGLGKNEFRTTDSDNINLRCTVIAVGSCFQTIPGSRNAHDHLEFEEEEDYLEQANEDWDTEDRA
jgi:hypothetical protein